MSYAGTRSAREAVLPVMTEGELAEWRHAEGTRVVQRWGRWWEEVRPGFFQPIHSLARQHRHQIGRPAAFCWGFRATLHDDDARYANGSLPVHVLTDPASYDADALPRKRRNKLRKCRRLIEIVQVMEPALLRDQGYEVRRSVADRLKIWAPPTKDRYLSDLDRYIENRNRLVLAGLSGRRLCGYLDAFAVDGTAYIDHVYLDSNALSTEVGTGLVFELVQACRRSGSVREVVYGLDVPSNRSLMEFKVKMGFPVVRVPASFWLLRPAGAFIRWWRPEVYYRLTGHGAGTRPQADRLQRAAVLYPPLQISSEGPARRESPGAPGARGCRRRGLPVPAPTAVDPETLSEDERARRGIVRLPQSLDEALDALAGDAAARAWFPEALFDAYLRHKRFEAGLMAELDRGARCARYSQAY